MKEVYSLRGHLEVCGLKAFVKPAASSSYCVERHEWLEKGRKKWGGIIEERKVNEINSVAGLISDTTGFSTEFRLVHRGLLFRTFFSSV